MIYLNNNTSAQTINIPYSQPDIPVTKEVQSQKDFTVTERGQYNINPDSGFSSMEKVHLTVDTPDVQEVFESGQTYQKSLMIEATITENGVYTRPDGYSQVNIAVSGESGVTISGMSYNFVSNDDNVKTFSAENGTAWSAVTIDASEKFIDGYKIAVNDLETNAVELSVSANGIYNADIEYETRGYIKKVIVNVSGGTQEPYFGKVARVENHYLQYFNLPFYQNDITNFNFIVGSLPSSGDGSDDYTELFNIYSEGTDPRYYEEGEPFKIIIDAFIAYGTYSTVGPAGYFLVIDMEVRDKNDNDIENPGLAVRVGLKDEIKINFKYTTNLEIEVINKTTGNNSHIWPDSNMRADILPTSMWFFEESSTPSSGIFYFKSYQHDSDYGQTAFVMPRSDGKLWDVNAGVQSDIVWNDGNGNTGNTFTTLYEWDIQ